MGEHARLGLGARLRGSARALGLTCREGQRWRHLRFQRRGFQAPPHPAAPRSRRGAPSRTRVSRTLPRFFARALSGRRATEGVKDG